MNFTRNESGLFVPETPDACFAGVYDFQLIRDGKVIDEFQAKNIIVNEGLNYLLNTGVVGTTQYASWYIGIYQGNYTPVASDTAASIATNSTECTSFTAITRQQFVPVASTAQSLTNAASRASFTFNGSVTIYGAFVCSSSTLNGATGTLLSAMKLSSSKSVTSGDQLLVTYSLTAASS